MQRSLVFLLSMTMLATPALAGDSEPAEFDTRYERYHASYSLNDDRSHVETREWAMTVLKERAVAYAKQASVTYSTSIQKAEVLSAYTRKADGRRIDAPKTNYQVEVNSGRDKDAPVFSDQTTLTVVFPDVAVGDTVVFAYRITQREAMFPGHFSVTETFSRDYPYDDVRVRIEAPSHLAAHYQAREMTEQVSDRRGRKTIEWTFRNPQPIRGKRRNFSVYDPDTMPGVSYSTFGSYAEIAAVYGARANPKAAVTDRVRRLADEIAKDRTEPREQARALYEWVATNISYAGNCIGVGAVVPHDLPFILDNRMGDCKDHATLLQALLAAKGIASTQALVNSGSMYRLPKIAVASNVNHVINYLPGLDLYVDSTSDSTPFGMLPFEVAGKPVLLVDGSRGDARTPVQPVGTNRQHMKTVLKIAPNGSAAGSVEVELGGYFAVDTRARMRNMPNDRNDELVKNVFRSSGYIGAGTFEKEDPSALLDSYRYKSNFTLEEFLALPGAGAFHVYPLFFSEAPVFRFLSEAYEPDESVEVACSHGTTSEEYRYEFPPNVGVLSVPDDLTVSNDVLSYRASYRLKGRVLTVKRIVEDRSPGGICSPEVVRRYKEVAAKAAQNYKLQVVYK
jgi:transglutaminase-like putative cysteine protease